MYALIEEENINLASLSVTLERAVIQHELQDDEFIYINEDGWFPFWICIMKQRGLVGLSTHTYFKKSTSQSHRLEFCNRINHRYFTVTAYAAAENKLKIDYVINFRDGMLEQTFIRGCRQFSRNIEIAMSELDPDNDIALRPGQTEDEAEDAGN